MRKYLGGELVDVSMKAGGIEFLRQNSQTRIAFLPWELAFGIAMAKPITTPTIPEHGIRIVEAEEDGA